MEHIPFPPSGMKPEGTFASAPKSPPGATARVRDAKLWPTNLTLPDLRPSSNAGLGVMPVSRQQRSEKNCVIENGSEREWLPKTTLNELLRLHPGYWIACELVMIYRPNIESLQIHVLEFLRPGTSSNSLCFLVEIDVLHSFRTHMVRVNRQVFWLVFLTAGFDGSKLWCHFSQQNSWDLRNSCVNMFNLCKYTNYM